MIDLNLEIEKMRNVGKIASKTLEIIKPYIIPGISTGKLNDICNEFILKHNAKSAILNYLNFPKSVCISINEVVCHGIPDYNTYIKNGDILNIDVAVLKDGFYSDTSKMFIVGKTSILGERICKIAKESLYLAIKSIKPGIKLSNIGKIIQKFVEHNGFSVVRDYCGHGIGKKFHEFPQVLHYYDRNKQNILLEPGMSITIEPMINSGSFKVKTMNDNWTVKTKDHGLSAQYEHTIIVTNKSFEITTIRSKEKKYFY